MRPEHGSKDHFGYGTLTFTLCPSNYPPLPVPAVPAGLSTEVSVGQVRLEWEPSAEYFANGYVIQRSEAGKNEFKDVAVYEEKVTNYFVDTDVEEGKAYEYRVAAVNKTGTSRFSESIGAVMMPLQELPAEWTYGEVGTVEGGRAAYAATQGGSVWLEKPLGSHGACGGQCSFCLPCGQGRLLRFVPRECHQGRVDECGLMLRGSLQADAPVVTMTLGHWGRRFARMGWRPAADEGRHFAIGNTYTWLPAWFKLARVGDVFYAYESTDGVNWYYVHSQKVDMPEEILVGMAGSFTGGEGQNGIVFDHLEVTDNRF